jgi:hypothetical protein
VASTVPGSQVDQVGVEAHGVKLNFAGRRTWSGTWSATFFESRSSSTRSAFVQWLEFMRSWKNNAGTYKQDYSVTAEVAMYDDLPQVVKRIRLYGLFPQSLEDVSLDNASGVVQYQVTFSYDWTEDL